jgi:hypothetical protein
MMATTLAAWDDSGYSNKTVGKERFRLDSVLSSDRDKTYAKLDENLMIFA